MRRREAGWGAAPRGPGLARPGTRAAAGAPPGLTKKPCQSWLTTLGPKPNACDHFSRGAFRAQNGEGWKRCEDRLRGTYGESGACRSAKSPLLARR